MKQIDDTLKIESLSLSVADLDVMLNFYHDVIGMSIILKKEREVHLGVDGKTLLVLIDRGDVLPKAPHNGLYHMALLLPEENDLLAFFYHLGSSDVSGLFQGSADHHFSQALYLQDPEGNGIEVYADRDKSMWSVDDTGAMPLVSLPLDIQKLVDNFDHRLWKGLPQGTTMGHVHLSVKSLVKAQAFFVDFLGFEVMISIPSALFISKNHYHHHFGMNTWARIAEDFRPDGITGLVSVTLSVIDIQALIQSLPLDSIYEVIKHENSVTIKDDQGIMIHIVGAKRETK